MKKIIWILGAVGVLTLASCKKDWVCQCTDNNDNNTYHDIHNATISDARNTCNSFEYNNFLGYNNCSLIE